MAALLSLALTLMAGKGPTTLIFSGAELSAWQQVTANGQIVGPVAGTPLAPKTPNCYGMWRMANGDIAIATDHFFTVNASLKKPSGGTVKVETIAGSSGRHLYRIRRGARIPLPRPEVDHLVHLDEISPKTWQVTRTWLLPGRYSSFGSGHLSIDVMETVAYYATACHPETAEMEAMGTIHRFDLRSGEALTDLWSRGVGSGGLHVLPDGSIIVGYTDGVQRVAPDGTLLKTYARGALRVGQGLVTGGATGSSFWVQGFEDGTSYSTLYEFALDGTILHQWNTSANGIKWDAPFVDPPPAVCVSAESLAFTSLVPSGGSDGDPAPVAYFSGGSGTFIAFSGSDVQQAGTNGQSEVADNGDFYTQNQEAYRDCSLDEFTGSPTESGNGRFSPPNTGTYSDLFFSKGSSNKFQALNHDGTVNHSFANQSIPSNGLTVGLFGAASGTVGYYAKALTSGGERLAVGRHDLTTDLPLSDLTSETDRIVRSSSSGMTHSIMVLRDETILVGWTPKSGASTTNCIKHYATDGTLLHTYDLSTSTSGQDSFRITQPVSGSDTFWVGYYGTTGALSGHSGDITFPTYDYFRVAQIRISDGTLLVDFAWSNQTVQDFFDTLDYVWSPDIGFWVTREDCNCMACPDPCEDFGIGEPYWALAPEFTNTYFYDRKWNSPPVSTLSTPGACQIAPSGDGVVYIAMDDTPNNTTIIYRVDPSTIDPNTNEATIEQVVSSVVDENGSPITIGELSGYHALFVLSCDRLLTVDRTTHDVVIICLPPHDDLTGTAQVETRLSLNIDPFDAQLVDGGDSILYIDTGTAKIWNIANDALAKTIGAVGGIWPVVLSNNEFFVYTGAFRSGAGDVLRYSRTGQLLHRATVDPGLYTFGLYNISADIQTDYCGCGNAKDGASVIVGEVGASGFPESVTLDFQGTIFANNISLSNITIVSLSDVTQGGVDTAAALAIINGAEAGVGFSNGGGGTTTRPVPNRHCGPEAGIHSPAPNPGCNDGGKGWTATYTGASGVVPTATDPTVGETLTGKDSVIVDVEVQHPNPPSGPAEVFRWALVELDDDERKEGRIRSIGDVEHGLSDAQGNMEAASVHIQVFDAPDRPMGSRIVDSVKQYFSRDEVLIRARSDAGRRANSTARMIMRALLYGESYGSSAVAQFTAVDPIHIDGGSFSPDKMDSVPFPLSFYTNAPKDLAQVQMKYYAGEKSDEGAISPITGLPNSRGLCSAFWVGADILGTGSGGEVWERFNMSLFACADVIAVYGSDTGGLGLYGRAAVVSTLQTSNPTNPSNTTETTLVTLDGSPDLSGVATDGTMQIVLFTTDGRTESIIIDADDFAKTVSIELALDPAVAQSVSWYISSIDYVPRRVKLDESRNGDDLMVPHWSGYIRPTPYEDFTCADGDFRVMDMWARGAVADAHKTGEVTFAFNVLGIEDQGDGSGTVINDFFTFANWFWDNRVHQQVTKPAGPGDLWAQVEADLPAYADGVTKTKSTSFADAQAQSVLSLGGNGLQISAVFGEGRSLRDTIQAFNDNGGCRHYIDEYGRVAVWVLDPYEDTSTWPLVHHVSRVFGDVKRARALDEAINVVKGGCDYDPEAQTFREDDLKAESSAAIARNKGIKRTSKHYDLRMIGSVTQAQYLLDKILTVQQDGPNYITIERGDIGLLDYPVGSGILFSSPLLPGTDINGMVDRPMVILSKTYHVDSHLVSLRCLDMEANIVPLSQQFILTNNVSGPVLSNTTTVAPMLAP